MLAFFFEVDHALLVESYDLVGLALRSRGLALSLAPALFDRLTLCRFEKFGMVLLEKLRPVIGQTFAALRGERVVRDHYRLLPALATRRRERLIGLLVEPKKIVGR